MECPRCNHPVVQMKLESGGHATFCDHCGWGKEQIAERLNAGETANPTLADVRAGDYLKFVLLWVGALIVVLGPYFGLILGRDWLQNSLGYDFLLSDEALRAGLNPTYWIVIALYVGLASAFEPSYDPDGAWLFFDNPFSYEDDWNRTMFTFNLLLLPGRLVSTALRATWRLLMLVIGRV